MRARARTLTALAVGAVLLAGCSADESGAGGQPTILDVFPDMREHGLIARCQPLLTVPERFQRRSRFMHVQASMLCPWHVVVHELDHTYHSRHRIVTA